jgi:hypothetical protein
VEDPGLDRVEHLGDQPEEPPVRGPVARRPVAVELGLLGLGEHVEAEAEVRLVGKAVHGGRVAVDRELERGLDPEIGVLPGGGSATSSSHGPPRSWSERSFAVQLQ